MRRWTPSVKPTIIWTDVEAWLAAPALCTAVGLMVVTAFFDWTTAGENALWAWALAGLIANALPPGAYGLAANPVTRWLLPMSIRIAFVFGAAMLVARPVRLFVQVIMVAAFEGIR